MKRLLYLLVWRPLLQRTSVYNRAGSRAQAKKAGA
jgi:hypothetical protein